METRCRSCPHATYFFFFLNIIIGVSDHGLDDNLKQAAHQEVNARQQYALNPHGGQLRAWSVKCTSKKGRGVLARSRHHHGMIDSNNSAQFCLGFTAKINRGVVPALGEIKILQGRISSPQAELRASNCNHREKMRGVNSALVPSHCMGGRGST